ncbi:MAG: leucyl aminopeptidase [Dehalococcoidia bacterium]|nr:leucyl aminopeptidase [Dehalococcoidia bacterium]
MEIKVIAGDIILIEADAVIVSSFEAEEQLSGVTAAIDKALDGTISHLISRGEIKGKFGEVAVVHTLGKLPSRIVAVAGLGKRQDFTVEKMRGAAGGFCRSLRKLNCHKVATILHGAGDEIELEVLVEAIAEGSLLGLYSFNQYKNPGYQDIEEMLIVEEDESKILALERGVRKGKIMAESTALARDMVNEPSNYMTPTRMSELAKEIADKHALKFKAFDSEDMKSMGMGGLLGVAKGSNEPPKLITLSYKGDEQSDSAIGFIGKGVTFDSGGISIKPSEHMEEMKDDMAGGAAVMAALKAIAELKPKVNVTAIVPATENLPSGTALKPGDILKAMNGKTIEVINTDAEGRLILADALSYAVEQKLSPLVDLATLTGACRVALGTGYSGVFSNNQQLADKVLGAAAKTGEKLWQMPVPEEYKEQIKSEIADIKNTGDRYGGAITAALFLAEFVGDTPWVHLDIAGPASSNKESGYIVKGATGVGVRTLVELALSLAS